MLRSAGGGKPSALGDFCKMFIKIIPCPGPLSYDLASQGYIFHIPIIRYTAQEEEQL